MRLIQRASLTVFILFLFSFAALAQTGKFTIQIEAAPTEAEAVEKLKQLKAKGIDAYILKSQVPGKGTFYRVRAGIFASADEARRYGSRLQQQGVVPEFFIAPFERPKDEAAVIKKEVKPAPAANTSAALKDPVKNAETPKDSSPKEALPKEALKEVASNVAAPTPAVKENAAPSAASSVASPSFSKYQDPQTGFSFEHPSYWKGKPLTPDEAKVQRVNAGATFLSPEDSAWLQAIWNELDKANSPTNDNNLIVDVILKSMKSGEGTQAMEELSRKVVEEKGQIKTYITLRATFIMPGQTSPMDYSGKAVIIRTNKGILLAAAFYSKDAPATVPGLTEKIIASVKAPE